jgi:cysteine desulfurase
LTPIYLDNNATTILHPAVAEAMDECHRAGYANPASQHFAGRRARRVLEEARAEIAELLGARTTGMVVDSLVFTSGGTEANNLAIRGLIGPGPSRLIHSAIEHPSLVAAARRMGESGHEIRQLPVDRNGVARVDALADLLDSRTGLVSLMLGNNETGVLQPVRQAVALCRPRGIRTHTDAVQCVAKIPVHFGELGVDAMTVSAHKFHGPVGIGALVVRRGVSLEPLLVGGFQQSGVRPGTESVALVVGMQRALQLWHSAQEQRTLQLNHLRDLFERTLLESCPDLVINGAAADRLPHTSNIAFLGLDRQALVMALDLAHIACSTGSACASGSSELSPVLLAMQVSSAVSGSSIRFSFSDLNTSSEVLEAARRISQLVNDLRPKRKSASSTATPPISPVTPV